MKKTLFPMLQQAIPFYFLSFFFVLGFGLVGTVFFEVVMRVSEVKSEDPKTFEMAFLMSLVAFMAIIFLFAMQIVQRNFQIVVGMSRTRKSFFAGSVLCALVSAVFGMAAFFIVALTEQLRLRYWWGSYPCESRFRLSFTPTVLFFFVLAFLALSQLIGVLFLRFGKLAFWVIWLIWMVSFLIIPRVIDDMDEERRTAFSGIGLIVKHIISLLPFFAWLLIGSGFLLVLLFVSYLMLMRQQVA